MDLGVLTRAGLSSNMLWLGLGFFAQGLFAARFIVQWISSERAGKSVVPVSFWYISLAGSLLLLIYAVRQQDPVFILGQSTGSFIYVRNLYLIKRTRVELGLVPSQRG